MHGGREMGIAVVECIVELGKEKCVVADEFRDAGRVIGIAMSSLS
jgi:hypothetical protein